ncbi:MAG TPA: hypothetical protein VIE65_23495 [Methylobacter sp.]|jgi:hypothetical protein
MTLTELKTLIAAGDVETICFWGSFKEPEDTKIQWSVAARDREGRNTVFNFGTFLTTSSRGKKQKQYTSLDRAYAAMKELGFEGSFEIDG